MITKKNDLNFCCFNKSTLIMTENKNTSLKVTFTLHEIKQLVIDHIEEAPNSNCYSLLKCNLISNEEIKKFKEAEKLLHLLTFQTPIIYQSNILLLANFHIYQFH